MPRVEIKEIEPIKLNRPIVIEGFPGIGMVGTISASYLAEKLGMKLVGYLASNLFPPIAAIHEYKPVSPARIYESKELNLIVLFSEFVVPAEIVYPLSEKIIEWAKKKGASTIYSLAGIASESPTEKIYGISSTPEIGEMLKTKGIELIREGATQGVSGILIAECASQGFPAANLMIQTNAPLDPKGSARLLNKLSEVIGIKIDTKPLVTEGEKIEKRIKEALEKMKKMHAGYEEFEKSPMYG